MESAGDLIRRISDELASVERELFTHPWIGAVERGAIERQHLGTFAAQQQRIIASDLRSVALLVHRYGGTPTGEFFAGSLTVETRALEALGGFVAALGLDRSRLLEIPPLAGAQAYTHFVAWLALYGSAAEFAAAFLVNLPAWGRNCGRLAKAFRSQYGMTDSAVAFFDLFAGDAVEFRDAAQREIQKGLEAGVTPTAIREAASLLQRYELMYWDSLPGAWRA